MTTKMKNQKPNLPTEGDNIKIMGLYGIVAAVEPYTDWSWRVIIDVPMVTSMDTITLIVPTDYRTTDGAPVIA